MGDWNESTEGNFLAGANLPPQGIAVTLTSIRQEMMQKRGAAEGVMEDTFIASFAESGVKDWIPNKTCRRFLKDTCGITSGNVHGFQSIPLTLLPTAPRGAFAAGIQAVPRGASQTAAASAPAEGGNIPVASDDVPF